MLEITVHKIAQVILMARELDRAEGELRAFLDALNEDELASLVALMWIGRGAFEPDDLVEALETARNEASTPTPDYLLGTPHLSDHLEAALELLDLSAQADEDELIRGG
ncbi:DUF3775 domain-containing protein [Pseudooceanicola sp. CBS1P-1]|uniref:DUF3775 domain-containing protein n=1 Tax=Pseudooceanicola albus TaxID=2692189 RepID=A0A6L7GDU5_9RHOB|nr:MULTISPECIES: DUF3775 domain-containing protein [Pseudooceanicola]MBT9386665.1 DUF3775 domain-containing protein [Pseudooceanicola endophyticus]MXN20923.1 DUF3775 domain-containing protein [Pseudooceanicola albus]